MGQPLTLTKNDTLEVEYFLLPSHHPLSQKYLFRFISPVKTVWMEEQISVISSLVDSNKSVVNIITDRSLEKFKGMIPITKQVVPEIEEMRTIEKVNIYECDMVRK